MKNKISRAAFWLRDLNGSTGSDRLRCKNEQKAVTDIAIVELL